jgi:menaquinone-dependent protoporphyrinogen oxidase
MTKVLVASASKHGSTEEIAEAIGDVLRAHGLEVEVKRLEDVDTLFPYDAYVLGSAVYLDGWLRRATHFVDRHGELIATRPTWLFSSGPIGDPAHVPVEESFDAGELVRRTQAREHRQFGGKLDKAQLSIGERAAAGLLRVPAGDYRQWDAITAWATAIGRSLTADLLV